MLLSKITGFCAEAPIIIFDEKGREFYRKDLSNQADNLVYFNLPAGKYTTSNVLQELPRPIKYICPELPRPERVLNIPPVKLVVANNPQKCTIYYRKGLIVLDPEFAAKPKPNLMHILYHEIGHFLYSTEWKADMFSCKQMLKRGYNPSQCLKTMLHNLNSNKKSKLTRASKNLDFLNNVTFTLNG